MPCRYEDTGDAVNNVIIFKSQSGKGSVTDLGEPAKFLQDYAFLFGENVWKGEKRMHFTVQPRTAGLSIKQITCDMSIGGSCLQV